MRFGVWVAGSLATALLAGCGGSALAPSVEGSGAVPQTAPKASGDLMYVSDTETGDVYVFSYPGGALQQTLTGLTDPGGECVDAKGDVFVTNTGGENVLEYAHGGKAPAATLEDPGYFPFGCAVDPSTGNLAVTNFSGQSSGQAGNVVIYEHAAGKVKKHYADSAIQGFLLCGYDDKGNLFVDGMTQASSAAFAELPKGGSKFTNLTLDQSIEMPGGVQWDGKYVAIGDSAANAIYQFSIAGKKGTKAGTTQLTGASFTVQFWIDGSRVAGADSGIGNVGVWKYPSGGAALKTITGLYVPLGVTISKASQ